MISLTVNTRVQFAAVVTHLLEEVQGSSLSGETF